MMIDRPAVFGDGSKMPFRDKSFDFVIASHILEHMADPAVFLGELSRVGKAGYIETPNVIFERLHPYSIHCLEVISVNDILHIHKKQQPVEDPFLGSLEFLQNDPKWKTFFYEAPDMFHVRHFWANKIEYPECKGELQKTGGLLCCESCKTSYPANPYPDFTHPLRA